MFPALFQSAEQGAAERFPGKRAEGVMRKSKRGVLQNATPPSKLPKVRNDLGQFVACGRVIEREGQTLMVRPSHSPSEG